MSVSAPDEHRHGQATGLPACLRAFNASSAGPPCKNELDCDLTSSTRKQVLGT